MVRIHPSALMEKTKLLSILKEEPLFIEGLSADFIEWTSLLSVTHPSLFFGVGLCTSKEAAIAIPFDILSFFFLAEKLRRELFLDTIFVLIADEHARTNAFMKDEIIRKRSKDMKSIFTKLIRNLHLKNFTVILSSDIHKDPQFQTILEATPDMPNQYLQKEIADMTWFTKIKNVRLKLGWSINADRESQGHDERFFDTQIHNAGTLPLSFLHTKAGRTFDENRPKTSPYISVENEARILLSQNENVQKKLSVFCDQNNTDNTRAAIHHINAIVRLFESLFIRIPKQKLADKVQFIIDLSTHS